MTEHNAQLLQAALRGDEQALAAVSQNPQAVRELQALRAAQPWVQAVAADAASLAHARGHRSTAASALARALQSLQGWLRPAVLVPATSLAAVLLLTHFHAPAPGVQPEGPAMTEQATSQEGIPQGLSAPARDALFVSDFDRPAPASPRHPARNDQLFDGNFEKNS